MPGVFTHSKLSSSYLPFENMYSLIELSDLGASSIQANDKKMARRVELPQTPPATPSLAPVQSQEETVCPRTGLKDTFRDANNWGDKKDGLMSFSEEEKEEKKKQEESTDSEDDGYLHCIAVPFNSPVQSPTGQVPFYNKGGMPVDDQINEGLMACYDRHSPNSRYSLPHPAIDSSEDETEGFYLIGEKECEGAKEQDSWCAVDRPPSGDAGYYTKLRFTMLPS
ncbi:uncharacterized protein KD926_002184 [Aspergillus affinis]|uniref:uncharacterized protein n=1 Tax=Aspergillus affinis TaxID=1070780 RepID=UPI0022FE6E1C|nr:uncharacterized protein KD926_002184 [Aspergillus affinis]KAI9036216.1 hypothetical protein KD926_002184 [Aspergillus affinis]